MYDFCPHCSQTLEVEQVPGQMLVCGRCGKNVGFVGALEPVGVSETEERIRRGEAARCPACQQVVDVKASTKSLVPHYQPQSRKICAGSGKPAPT